ncbi:hypothetical protein C2G38_2205580 [Gigaspora rosea]|uniref:Uncharacterized protein n=1 Tax=Gigaspora rosea TaxID=44941 RepID=A0A397UTX3_9GLOM|nr:hypothetical protein C2G38_2205580 [Gigaspora rosea]
MSRVVGAAVPGGEQDFVCRDFDPNPPGVVLLLSLTGVVILGASLSYWCRRSCSFVIVTGVGIAGIIVMPNYCVILAISVSGIGESVESSSVRCWSFTLR